MDNLSKQRQKEAQEKADKIISRLAVETVDETTLIQYVSNYIDDSLTVEPLHSGVKSLSPKYLAFFKNKKTN